MMKQAQSSPKILFVSEAPYRGGAEEYLLQMARYVHREQRWRVTVALPPDRALDSLRCDLMASNIEVIALETNKKPVKIPIRGLRRLQFYWNELALVRQIQKIYRNVAPDLIHINLHYLTAGRALLFAAAREAIPHVAVIQLAPKPVPVSLWDRLQQAYIQRRGCIRWITVAEDSKRHIIATWGMPPESVAVIPNGVNLELYQLQPEQIAQARRTVRQEFRLPDDALLITTVAAFDGRKGQDVLAHCVRPVLNAFPNVRFLWVGDGERRNDIKQLIIELNVENYVIFAGRRSDVPRLLAGSDLFVLPTFFESLPFALLEAMAAGLPCVASGVNGIPEALRDGIDGILVPPRDSDKLTAAILLLLNDPELAAKYGRAAQQRSLLFSAEEMCCKTFEIYQALLSSRKSGTK